MEIELSDISPSAEEDFNEWMYNLQERSESDKPWDKPGAKPRYTETGKANYPNWECGCMSHWCDGC